MSQGALTYRALQHEINKRMIGYAFRKGPGGPLLFLWVLGAGLLGVLFDQPLWALAVTGICAVAGGLIVRDHLRNSHIQGHLIRSMIEERSRVGEIFQDALRELVARGVTYVIEIVFKIIEITKMHGPDEHLFRVLGEADKMVALQFEAARQIEEFHRILALVHRIRGSNGETNREEMGANTARLRQQNLAAIEEALNNARASIDEINQQLETLMLQVVQMEKRKTLAVAHSGRGRRDCGSCRHTVIPHLA